MSSAPTPAPGRSLTRQPSRWCRSCKDLIYMFYAARRLQPTLQGIHGDPARNRLLFGISPRWRLDKHVDLLAHKGWKIFGSESVDDLEDSRIHAFRIVCRQRALRQHVRFEADKVAWCR